MKKYAVVGVYGSGEDFTTGQAVKCHELIDWLIEKYGVNDVDIVNTYKWKKNPIKLFNSLIKVFKECENIIILPAQHGLKVFAPLCYYLNKKYKRKLEYIVIGGWLANTLKKNNRLKKYILNFDGVFVETKSMVNDLNNVGINKCYYLPNTRMIPNGVKRIDKFGERINVCTYSRVTEDKGILDAIEIVKKANNIIGKNMFNLHIYGKVDEKFRVSLEKQINDNKDIVQYLGVKNADQGVETLANYFCLLFPTYYEGEGFAGTILDGFAAGTPVIANDWKYNSEIIIDGKDGFIYSFRDLNEAAQKLCLLYNDKKIYKYIQRNEISKSKNFSPDIVYSEFIDYVK